MKANKGSILIELLIAILIGVFLSIAIVVFYSSLIGSKSEIINRHKLNSQIANATLLMQKHIARAGYWSGIVADVETGSNNNPFILDEVDLQTNIGNSCILFAYDSNNSGVTLPSLNVSGSDERYGFRRVVDSSTGNGMIQMRPLSLSTFSCSDSIGSWNNITDPKDIDVTSMTFIEYDVTVKATDTDTDTDTGIIQVRTVTINITAELERDSSIQTTISREVRIKNDKFTPIT